MAKPGTGIGLSSLAIGAVFIYGGIKGYSPLKAMQNIILGKSGSFGQNAAALTDPGGSNSSTTAPTAPGNPTGNQAIGKQLAAAYGWDTGAEWDALVALWNRESGWRTEAKNPTSGAYGIPQSLPASKMASAGSDYLTNPATQIKWGLGYIKSTYGSPSAAWAHEQSAGWY